MEPVTMRNVEEKNQAQTCCEYIQHHWFRNVESVTQASLCSQRSAESTSRHIRNNLSSSSDELKKAPLPKAHAELRWRRRAGENPGKKLSFVVRGVTSLSNVDGVREHHNQALIASAFSSIELDYL